MIFIIIGIVFGIAISVKEKVGVSLAVALTIFTTICGVFCSIIIGGIIGINLPLEGRCIKEVQLISLSSNVSYNCDTLEDNTIYVWRDGNNYTYMYVENDEIVTNTVSGSKSTFYTDNQNAIAKIYSYTYKQGWYYIIASPILFIDNDVEFYLPENSVLL